MLLAPSNGFQNGMSQPCITKSHWRDTFLLNALIIGQVGALGPQDEVKRLPSSNMITLLQNRFALLEIFCLDYGCYINIRKTKILLPFSIKASEPNF